MRTPNKPAIKLWVEMLRSGKFEQTTNHLHTPAGFCCLGVVCEVYSANVEPTEWESVEERMTFSFLGSAETLPNEVVEWLGVESNNPTLFKIDNKYGADYYDPAKLNDKLKLSFDQIADVIEWAYLSEPVAA